MAGQLTFIYGKHALFEALTSVPHVVERVFVVPPFNDGRLNELIKRAGISLTKVQANTLPRGIDPTVVHQNVIAEISVKKLMCQFDHFIEELMVTSSTALVLLGEIEDPQNVGAIIRSAAALGAAGILISEHHQAQISGAVIKVSAGMAFKIPLIAISNINHTLRELKDKGFWIYGLSETAEMSLASERFDRPSVFVLGNESEGIRQKTLETCDILLKIPISSHADSLNVATAAAITLYAWSTQHPQVL
ncbi:MAG: 23S rRNA (guanosine(2251)-2'-O)-methyltransferase RlmB [Candidatus Vogelbacteria bacterium]|nr:23S rRNA (guanosine(2251)-2'-O)-methyltransferase RlmB [Candidatus Vogelbacteria bacterium]